MARIGARLAVLFALLLAAVGAPALTVATYNVENYLVTDRRVDGVYRPAFPKPETEKVALRAVIRRLDADVLALQEMGPQPFLDELRRDLRAEGLDYPHAVLLPAADEDRHVAVLSRVPFRTVHRHARIPVKPRGVVKRGALEAVVATDRGDLSVFVLHLKSRRTDDPADPEGRTQRAAEAVAVRDLVLRRHPRPAAALLLVCGDWNDSPTSRPIRALTRRGDTRIGHLLPAADSRGETWTHVYRKEDVYSRIDYLMVSPALRRLVVAPGARILDGPDVGRASDHRPVVVTFDLRALSS
jgi:endonuclease/exonuclease/phosphatase family metal-dependent hydrolase